VLKEARKMNKQWMVSIEDLSEYWESGSERHLERGITHSDNESRFSGRGVVRE
jgi:hypothetical protein